MFRLVAESATMKFIPLVLIAWLGVVSLLGCGTSKGVVVRGELRQRGERYRPADGEQVMIFLAETTDGNLTGEIFPTRLDKDGTFAVVGPDQVGIRPGTYRVGITSMPEIPVPGKSTADGFGGTFELAKSPLTITVDRGQGSVTIEIP